MVVGMLYHVNEEEDHERTRSDALPLLLHIYTGGHDPRVRWVGQTNAIVGSNRAERVRPMVVGQCSAWVRAPDTSMRSYFSFATQSRSHPVARRLQRQPTHAARRLYRRLAAARRPRPAGPFGNLGAGRES